ncbi:MAG: cadmium carbonic anhydrase [Gammaproteobacteria bacterium]|nr:cadmium carbonic anhydrase [Gammaproteobacteria bacterium]
MTALASLAVACGNDESGETAAADAGSLASASASADDSVGAAAASAAPLCVDAGPQTPRDISNPVGVNTVRFELAPPANEMNLCNIHTHTNAEHKGPGFEVFVGGGVNGGFACNESDQLTAAELTDPFDGEGAYQGVKPGDTIEVHWVHSTCDVAPGEGLGACLTDGCSDPLLRVEAQVFLVVNDPDALDFADFAYRGDTGSLHQARALPAATGEPVVFRGSTTGPSYDQSQCSPAQVTWSVRPQCARLDISSLHRWAAGGNVFNETASHGVRQLVEAPELLAPIE